MQTPSKLKDVAALLATLTARIARIKATAEGMSIKRGKIYIEWLRDHADYLKREVGFKPSSMRRYKRSEIVNVNFGFNVGSEIGGRHFAIIVSDSDQSNPVVNVIPLGSLEAHQTEADLHKKELYLGVIPGMNGLQSYAIPNQLRPVSKLRILAPTAKNDPVIKIAPELMDMIDKKVVSLYVKGYVSLKELAEKEEKKVAQEEVKQGLEQVAIAKKE